MPGSGDRLRGRGGKVEGGREIAGHRPLIMILVFVVMRSCGGQGITLSSIASDRRLSSRAIPRGRAGERSSGEGRGPGSPGSHGTAIGQRTGACTTTGRGQGVAGSGEGDVEADGPGESSVVTTP